jgi:hypothetical protein
MVLSNDRIPLFDKKTTSLPVLAIESLAMQPTLLIVSLRDRLDGVVAFA